MILTALHELYQRRMSDPDPAGRLPAYGLEEKEIPFIIDIDVNGKLVNLTDTRSSGGKSKGQKFLLPQAVKRAVNISANLLWDNAEYVLGVDSRGKPERVVKQHEAFRDRIRTLPDPAQQDAGIVAVNRFLDQFAIAQMETYECWGEIVASNPNMSFRLHGDIDLVCQRPAIINNVSIGEEAEMSGVCLLSGEKTKIERLHAAIKNVWGAQTAGANIVSFNANAYCSYGKGQGANSPVSKRAAFAYTTALNDLLQRNSRQRIQVGDASTVFWAEKNHDLETAIPDAFGEPPKDDPGRGSEAVKRLYEWAHSGKPASFEGNTKFYILGLAPNAARISVRFWEMLPLRDLAARTLQHYEDLRIARANFDPEYPSLFRLLTACATQNKAENIPPNLGGEIMHAILAGSPYPTSLLAAAVRRCRAAQDVNYFRAAIIKACLNRAIRRSNLSNPHKEKEFCEMLDPENQSTAYRLGRLFAVLEKLQQEANPGINATIRDRYYGAASSNPVTVFTSLLRLHHHHLAKLNPGRRINLEKMIGEVMADIEAFPSILPLPEQGRFALGYYHQRQALFTKSNNAV